MRFSIIIPTCNNYKYLKLCVESLLKNSSFEHEIIIHINGNNIDTENFLKDKKINYTHSDENIGLCSGVNLASSKAKNNYIVYSHDDMYFLPEWDFNLQKEISKLPNNLFYLSSTQISSLKGEKNNIQHIQFDAGNKIENFNEDYLLKNFRSFKFNDLQGSHWAPHVIHRNVWREVGGFSEEYNPGYASDPDLNMKLWKFGVRLFKSVNNSRVYHFGSLTTRKNPSIERNDGKKTFLLKWKMTVYFFVKHYLNRGKIFDEPLTKYPIKNINFYFDFIIMKFKYYYTKIKNAK